MALDVEITTAMVAAGAALAGSGITLFAEWLRRGWEDRRRWGETTRLASREFLYGTQQLYAAVSTLTRVRQDGYEISDQLESLKSAVEAGDTSQERREELTRLRVKMASARSKQAGLSQQVAEGWDRVQEASADLYLLCGDPVQDAARAHQDLLMDIHQRSKTAMSNEVALVIPATATEFAGSRDRLRTLMRRELGLKATR